MSDQRLTPMPGVTVTIDRRAVRVSSERPLVTLSSAVVGGGAGNFSEIVNMHVDDRYDGERPEDDLAACATSLGVETPFIGLMTAAYTEFARVSVESARGLTVAAVVSVGLSNTSCAGLTPPIGSARVDARAPSAQNDDAPAQGTINVILLIDAGLTAAAMVNAVITATEAKTMVLAEWSVMTPEGDPASGTSTDTVVVACTGRGPELAYAGPATLAGWLAARTVRSAMTEICRDKLERDGGRRLGW